MKYLGSKARIGVEIVDVILVHRHIGGLENDYKLTTSNYLFPQQRDC